MNTYYIKLGFTVDLMSRAASPDDLDGHLDELMDCLADEPGVFDADISAELATGCVALNMYVRAADDGAAMAQAWLAARSAIHAAGCFTGGWLDYDNPGGIEVDDAYDLRVQAELVDC